MSFSRPSVVGPQAGCPIMSRFFATVNKKLDINNFEINNSEYITKNKIYNISYSDF